ncbi:ensconsin isoform X2 [Syngnathus scovelli]|uniref:ensconsin isoform X2 n=1 Tax=Syngnathus scovelli TaxID=161590 RepID=UPI002110C54C|nr:ensconsin isoform X2 [Syngnathus scovelli]
MPALKSIASAWQGPVRRTAREVASGTNVDERLKAARERREEQQRLLASRVHSRFERERRAKLHYEQQLLERQKKLQEQKLKEDMRRAAVEEKRQQRLKEEKERNESAVRRTQEKSQRAQENFSQNVRGRKPAKNAPRHIVLSTWEKNLVSRLLTPTSSYLARSKSAVDQSAEEVVHICRRAVSFYSTTSSSPSRTPQKLQDNRPQIKRPPNQRAQDQKPQIQKTPNQRLQIQRPQIQKPQVQRLQNQKPQIQKPQVQRLQNQKSPIQKHQIQRLQNQKPQTQRPVIQKSQNLRPPTQRPPPPHLSPSHSQRRNTSGLQPKATTAHIANKKTPNVGPNARSPPNHNGATKTSRTASSPSPDRAHRRSSRRHSNPLQLDLESVPEEDVPICNSALSPGNCRPARVSAEDKIEDSSDTLIYESEAESRTAGDGPSRMLSPPPEAPLRRSNGTSDPEEASRSLAVKRREARLLRELEEQESLAAAEAERRSREELERREAEERARQQAETERLIAEKQRREEDAHRRAEEERAQAMHEAALLQKQREEEQAREREKAAQAQKERELAAQKEEAERQVRKKRLEEIMRRTRRTVSPDTKSATVSILPKENNETPVHDAVKLPAGSRPSQTLMDDKDANDDMVPVVAFKERRSLRTLTGLEDIQTHQRAEVI